MDGQVNGLDHGICLHTEYKLRTVLWGWVCQPNCDGLIADITAFAADLPGALANLLSEHITDAEIDALAQGNLRLLAEPVIPAQRTARPIPLPAF